MNKRVFYAAAVGLFVVLLSSHFRSTPYNNYVLLADAMLHGHLWINWPGNYIDAVEWHNHRFIVNDPLPALFMLPVVALFGTGANQTMLAAFLAAVAVGAAWRFCELLGCTLKTTIWLCAFYLIGTDLLWCSMLGDVWFVAQTSAVCMMTLALAELAGRNRPWMVMLLFVGATASRFTMITAVPALIYLVMRGGLNDQGPMPRTRGIAQMGAIICGAAIVWVSYNLARWGVPWDSGHTIFYHQDATAGSQSGSPFSFGNLPYQLWSFFVQAPDFTAQFPWIVPSLSGVALTWTSPALLFAFWARRPRNVVIALWAAALLTAAPSMLYFVNGYAQFGMRHALDFMPFLFALMVLAARERLPAWTQLLIGYSVVAGAWGVWYWDIFVRPNY